MNLVEAVIAGLKRGADFAVVDFEGPRLSFRFPGDDIQTAYSYYARDKLPEKRPYSPAIAWWGVLCFLTTAQFETGSGFGLGGEGSATVTWRAFGRTGGRRAGRQTALWESIYYGWRPDGQENLKRYLAALMMHIVVEEIADRIGHLAGYENIELTKAMKKDLEALKQRYRDPRPRIVQALDAWARDRAKARALDRREAREKAKASIRI